MESIMGRVSKAKPRAKTTARRNNANKNQSTLFKEFRKALGFTQFQMGKLFELHPQNISNIERGSSVIPVSIIEKLRHVSPLIAQSMLNARMQDWAHEILPEENPSLSPDYKFTKTSLYPILKEFGKDEKSA